MEPYYYVEVQAPADCVSAVYTVLARRRLALLAGLHCIRDVISTYHSSSAMKTPYMSVLEGFIHYTYNFLW